MSLCTPAYCNSFRAMNSGLSSRTEKIVSSDDPTPLTVAPQPTQCPCTIDLSNAQNEVLRPELLDFLKHVVQNEMSTDASAQSRWRHDEPLTKEADLRFAHCAWRRSPASTEPCRILQHILQSPTTRAARAHSPDCRRQRRNRARDTCRVR